MRLLRLLASYVAVKAVRWTAETLTHAYYYARHVASPVRIRQEEMLKAFSLRGQCKKNRLLTPARLILRAKKLHLKACDETMAHSFIRYL